MLMRSALTLALLAGPAMASVSGGASKKAPLTDWIIVIYDATNNIYIPAIGLACLVIGAANLGFGFFRFGPAVGRIIACIGILVLGVAFFADMFGGNPAIALVR